MTCLDVARGWRLRITMRCLTEDLGFQGSDIDRPVHELESDIVRAFLSKRGQSPVGTEKLQPITSKAVVYTLHATEDRGVTWHHQNQDVVWLCAARFHRSGERDDAYPFFKALDAADRLLPKREPDYNALYRLEAFSFAAALLSEVPSLLDRAAASPGTEIRHSLGGRVPVRLVIERYDDVETTWVALSSQFEPGDANVPGDWLVVTLSVLLPGVTDFWGQVAGASEWPRGPLGSRWNVFAVMREVAN
jgi:hypothetical protein